MFKYFTPNTLRELSTWIKKMSELSDIDISLRKSKAYEWFWGEMFPNVLKKEDENNGVLYTGDIGYLEDGLLYIEGRKNREVKINGRRIRLEHLEENWKKYFRSNMVCSFDDSKLYLLVEGKISEENVKKLREWIPILEKDIIAREVDKLPRKANGKVNVAFRA